MTDKHDHMIENETFSEDYWKGFKAGIAATYRGRRHNPRPDGFPVEIEKMPMTRSEITYRKYRRDYQDVLKNNVIPLDMTTAQIADWLGIKFKKTYPERYGLSMLLRESGYVQKQKSRAGKPIWIWKVADTNEEQSVDIIEE